MRPRFFLMCATVLIVGCGGDSGTELITGPNVSVEIDCDEGWPASPAQSLYILPFQTGRTVNVSQSYCNPTNSHNFLHAYDIDTEIGDTLVASRSGTVLFVRDQFADNNATSGEENWVWIQHADGSVMNYVHITTNGALVSVGDLVEQGQAFAISGNSGLTHRPHVHTALYRDATDFTRQASIPIAYRNAEGALDSNGGLIVNQSYTALADGG